MNWYVLAFAVSAFVYQNNYFGWNAKPQSDAELIADLITILIFALAFLEVKK